MTVTCKRCWGTGLVMRLDVAPNGNARTFSAVDCPDCDGATFRPEREVEIEQRLTFEDVLRGAQCHGRPLRIKHHATGVPYGECSLCLDVFEADDLPTAEEK